MSQEIRFQAVIEVLKQKEAWKRTVADPLNVNPGHLAALAAEVMAAAKADEGLGWPGVDTGEAAESFRSECKQAGLADEAVATALGASIAPSKLSETGLPTDGLDADAFLWRQILREALTPSAEQEWAARVEEFKAAAAANPQTAYREALANEATQVLLGKFIGANPAAWALVKDTLERGGVRPGKLRELEKVSKRAWTRDVRSRLPPRRRSVIYVDAQFRQVVAEVRAFAARASLDNVMYLQGRTLVRVAKTKNGPEIAEVTAPVLAELVGKYADWCTAGKNGMGDGVAGYPEPAEPPTKVLQAVLDRPGHPDDLRELERIARAPYFSRTGELIVEDGYDEG
ncbi:MAG: hypothetical protein WCP21_18520, partial [Armatimonadota bacterium]